MKYLETPQTIFEEAIANRVFPGGVFYFSRGDELLQQGAVGMLGYGPPFQIPVLINTLYDLASVTKIYTLALVLLLLREAKIPLKTHLSKFFPIFEAPITLGELMSHRSGISFRVQSLEDIEAEDWIKHIATVPLENSPGTSGLYCCTNYFLLARVAEEIGKESMENLLRERILKPLKIENIVFEPSKSQQVAPTEQNENGFWQGIAHDEAARRWRLQTGTCAGNAGLFATAADVAKFASVWTQNGAGILHPEDVSFVFTTRFPEDKHWRGLGFQIDASYYMSEAAPQDTAGHTGFTGPALMLHPASERIVVILANRVHPSCSGPDRLPYLKRIAETFFQR